MRRLAVTALFALVGILGLPHAADAEDGSLTADAAKEAEFVRAINELRSEHGLPELHVHAELAAKARDWSRTMAQVGDIWHSDLRDGITADWKHLGENVGMGGSVPSLHRAFIDSPGHHANLVDPGFRFVGLGVTVNSEGTIFVSEVFMEPASQPVPATPSPTTGTPSSSSPEPAAPAPLPEVSPPAPPAPVAPAAATAVEHDSGTGSRLASVLHRLRALDG